LKLSKLLCASVLILILAGCESATDLTPLPELTAQEQWDAQVTTHTLKTWIISKLADPSALSTPENCDKLLPGYDPGPNIFEGDGSGNYTITLRDGTLSIIAVIAFSWDGTTIGHYAGTKTLSTDFTIPYFSSWDASTGMTIYFSTLSTPIQNLSGL